MISLTSDRFAILNSLNTSEDFGYIKNIVKLYLDSYGVTYDFVEYYIQTDTESERSTAVLLRYNNFLYCSVGEGADFAELSSFILGFYDCECYCNKPIFENTTDAPDGEVCYVMSKSGEKCTQDPSVISCENVRTITDIVTSELTYEKQTDFFLNTSHMLRHSTIKVFSYIVDNVAVCVAAFSCNNENSSVIPFVYTEKYFRGNGYCRRVLDQVCSDKDTTYQLLCEEHNIKFYEKCGFSQIDFCLRYRL